jgi:hypothetical protein
MAFRDGMCLAPRGHLRVKSFHREYATTSASNETPGFQITDTDNRDLHPVDEVVALATAYGWPQNYAPAYTRSHAYYGEATYLFRISLRTIRRVGCLQTGCAKRPASLVGFGK